MAGTASAVWPQAGLAIYVPFSLEERVVVPNGLWLNGATVGNGNGDMAIYSVDGTKLTSKVPIATAGINTLQTFDFADVTLSPGVYYMALMLTSALDTMFRGIPVTQVLVGLGVAQEDCSGTGVLPAVATFAQIAFAYLPLMAVEIGTIL